MAIVQHSVTRREVDAAAEIDLPDGTRVRVGNGASAALLRELFAALDRR